MKKIIILMLVALIAIVPTFAMTNEDPEEMIEVQEVYLISGEIAQIDESGILINAGESGMVLVNITDETIMETGGELAAGDYIHVDYNGMMTRSIPAGITAQVVRCYTIEGTVSEIIAEEGGMLLETETHGQVYAHLPEGDEMEIKTGDAVKVYFNGAMTMSLPGQINADNVVVGKD